MMFGEKSQASLHPPMHDITVGVGLVGGGQVGAPEGKRLIQTENNTNSHNEYGGQLLLR